MTRIKHKHKWQFVKEFFDNRDVFETKTKFKFACECGKSKIVYET